MIINPHFKFKTTAPNVVEVTTGSEIECVFIETSHVPQPNQRKNAAAVQYSKSYTFHFNLMLSYIELRCANSPGLFYPMPSTFMIKHIQTYRPQFYLSYKRAEVEGTSSNYMLHFTNKFASDICHFGVRQGNAAPETPFTSHCGDGGKDCYAPCKDVELTAQCNERFVEIIIQQRRTRLAPYGFNFNNYTYKKLGISLAWVETLISDR